MRGREAGLSISSASLFRTSSLVTGQWFEAGLARKKGAVCRAFLKTPRFARLLQWLVVPSAFAEAAFCRKAGVERVFRQRGASSAKPLALQSRERRRKRWRDALRRGLSEAWHDAGSGVLPRQKDGAFKLENPSAAEAGDGIESLKEKPYLPSFLRRVRTVSDSSAPLPTQAWSLSLSMLRVPGLVLGL